MRTETKTVRIGEDMGPVDWSHPIAKDMPPIWREAEANPEDFTFSEYRRTILKICMYDGWPYWKPRPAIQFIGPLNSAEWTFFDSYAVWPSSIERRDSDGARSAETACPARVPNSTAKRGPSGIATPAQTSEQSS